MNRLTAALTTIVCVMAFGACGTADAARSAPSATRSPRALDPSSPSTVAAKTVEGSQEWLYLTDAALDDAVDAVAARTAAPQLRETIRDEVTRTRDALASSPGPVWWSVRPLATRTVTVADRRAVIDVWTVAVLAAPSVAVPQSFWRTYRVELAWQRGWRLAGLSSTPGPTPQPSPTDDPWINAEFAAALRDFTRLVAT